MSDTFRKAYRELNDAEKAQLDALKSKAEEIEAIVNAARENGKDGRYLSLAMTHLETSVMFAVKAITG